MRLLISRRVPGTLRRVPHAQGVESVVVRGPGVRYEASRPCSSPSVASRGSDMLSYAASSSLPYCRDSGPPQKCFRPSYAHNTQACKLPVFLLHYVIAEKGVGHAIDGEEGRTVCRGIVQG